MKKKKQSTKSGVLPELFVERMKAIFGSSALQIEKTFVERPTTFRLNPLKGETVSVDEKKKTAYDEVSSVLDYDLKSRKESIRAQLSEFGFKINPVIWKKDAFVLQNKSKRELTDLPLYNEGKIYIQSLASMVPPLVLNPQPGEKVLDLTAAPGSKTSQIAAMMQRKGELVGNDVNKVRFFKLKHNMELLGVSDVVPEWKFTLRLEDGSHLCGEYGEYFDKILVDAPCSAEARFVVGNIKSFGYWSEKKIKEMATKQRKLLFSAWYALKPGGTLVYSTCTFAPEENELQISKLLERFDNASIEPVDVSSILPTLKVFPALTQWKEKKLHDGVKKCLRIFPTNEIEGFFVAKIRKN